MSSSPYIRPKVQLAQEVILMVARILDRDLSAEQAFAEMLKWMCDQLGWASGSFWMLDEASNLLICQMNHSCEPCPAFHAASLRVRLKKGEGLPGRIWESGVPIWIADVWVDENFPRIADAKKDGLRTGFGFPLTAGGKFIGLFEFFSKTVKNPDSDLINAFAIVGTALGQFLERRRVELELGEQAALNSYAAEIGTALNYVNGLPAILQNCAELTLRHLDVSACRIWVVQDDTKLFLPEAQAGDGQLLIHAKADSQIDPVPLNLSTGGVTGDGFGSRAERFTYYCAFPLRMNDHTVGAISIFGMHQPSPLTIDVLYRVATNISLYVARKRSEEKLHVSESTFREFAGAVDECFFISAPRLTEHYYVSPGFETIWGVPPEAVLNNADAWREVIQPEHRQRVDDYVDRLVGDTMPDQSEIDYPITKPDGSTAWLSARCSRIDHGDGTWHICGTVRDITERKLSEQRISDFYSTVSHELRTPLTSIKGSLLLLERGKGGDMPIRAFQLIQIARKECDRLIRLINDMLDMKTIEVGKLQLYRESLNPVELVAETIDLMRNLSAEMHVELKVEVATNRTVFADKDRIIQVLTNLLSNALKFSPQNSQVVVKLTDADDFVRFSVADCGPGIAKEFQGNLFNLFPRVEPEAGAGKPGTGLGLVISKGIVDEHGGTIGVMSEKGAGAVFWFEIPTSS
jgi:PAS domain S-box-containing protein